MSSWSPKEVNPLGAAGGAAPPPPPALLLRKLTLTFADAELELVSAVESGARVLLPPRVLTLIPVTAEDSHGVDTSVGVSNQGFFTQADF